MSQNESLGSVGQDARGKDAGSSGSRSGEPATWNEERIIQLRQLWEEGLSASSIGRVLGVTKNAVVGKAHRLKLSSRPSPIRKSSKPPVRKATVLARPTLPAEPMVSLSGDSTTGAAAKAGGLVATRGKDAPAVSRLASSLAPKVPEKQPAAPLQGRAPAPLTQRNPLEGFDGPHRVVSSRRKTAGRVTTCSWPIGDPGDADFRFCGADTLPGKSYCAEHCAMAYVTKNRSDSEAA
ncbi:MAG: GcrA family cell cycle regulator [Pseudomonadota bacterium]